jgi:hypothetical protein
MADSPKRTPILLTFALLAASAVAAAMQAPQSTAEVPPSHIFNVRDYGATGDGATLDTAARCTSLPVSTSRAPSNWPAM